ncbi:ras-like GTP-binding protein rhoA [Biomphalaria glabrata]|uniref:Ras-like GTP-binding protein rhoA n=2 Tax=Biomphalaria TaxID=6525 RepID=A0A9W2YJD4_BIOGL|nr:ras-like GTP-binding protein rhoA [Biomphalaria glabrata]KAK0069003.1 ras-like GTP-binding protein rhoA [Biomphalaria pfeifferi]
MCWLSCCTGSIDPEEEILLRQKKAKNFNVAVVGDTGCGKTNLIYRFTRGKLPEKDTPSVLDTDEVEIIRKRDKIKLYIHDTSGDEGDARVRNLAYQNSDVIIICFSIDSEESRQNVVANWRTDIRHLCRDTPFLLVGTKRDTRGERGTKVVSKKDGAKTAKTIGAICYLEFSAFEGTRSNRQSKVIFGRAIQACLDNLDDALDDRGCCCC